MRQSLPWESVPPPIYTARLPKQRKRWVTAGGWILSAVLLIFGATAWDRMPLVAAVSMVFAVLYVITLVTKKDSVVTTRGLEIFYEMRVTTHYDFYPWEQINAIVREDRNHPDFVRLHIGYGSMEKALFFTRPDAEAITKLAKEKNPAIRVLDYANAESKTARVKQRKK